MRPLSLPTASPLQPVAPSLRLFGPHAQRSTLFADARLARLIERWPAETCAVLSAASAGTTPHVASDAVTGAERLAAVRAGRTALVLADAQAADLFYEAALAEIVDELGALEREPVRPGAVALLILPQHASVELAGSDAALAVRLMRGAATIAQAPPGAAQSALDLVAGAGVSAPPGAGVAIDPHADVTVIVTLRYDCGRIARARRLARFNAGLARLRAAAAGIVGSVTHLSPAGCGNAGRSCAAGHLLCLGPARGRLRPQRQPQTAAASPVGAPTRAQFQPQPEPQSQPEPHPVLSTIRIVWPPRPPQREPRPSSDRQGEGEASFPPAS